MHDIRDRILFVDAEAIVIDKPAGLSVHPGPATRESLEDALGELRLGFLRTPAPVHRLDRDTSGCLLLSRNPKAHKRFARTFEEGRAEKVYIAVLEGIPAAEDGVVGLALTKISSPESGWRMVPDPSGRPAQTEYAVIGRIGERALVRFRPRTGRTHQIRVHAAAGLGCPVAGDPVYGDGVGPTLLHALELRVPRESKPAIEARAPLPRPFAEAGFDDAGL
ncbi:RluA family pseudouridine synthase [Sphingosinicella sp. CPCC 101087]|uniref:RluA family pseudouridine synthase n=1 Tax=Sphingosinicella sp. CPCC 101087 TaxID=2497754 RepID=UPI00101CCEDA|nr:RNA pseudouridine synthase [Sphingosinicella sp. CPCC 101087]